MIALRESFDGPDESTARAAPPTTPEVPADLVELTSQTFAAKGWLQTALQLEHRPQQEAMAVAVAQAYQSTEPLIFEAGTGVGKSLAYLIPSILLASATKRQCIISTNTIALQEQIMHKDLQLCRDLFGKSKRLDYAKEFHAALLVGKGNYLCQNRLAQAIRNKAELFPNAEQNELVRLTEWAAVSKTGIRHELSPKPISEVWDWVNADSSACSKRTCTPETCFYRRARAKIEASQVLIINHSLLFALLGAGVGQKGDAPGILFPNDFLVLDEAHTIPDIATDYAGEHLSSYSLDRLLKMLYNPRTKRGIFAKAGTADDLHAIDDLIHTADYFFKEIRETKLKSKPIIRLYEPNWVENALDLPITRLLKRAGDIANRVDDDNIREELRDMSKRLNSLKGALATCIEFGNENHVYWIENTGRRHPIVHLRTAPLDVAPFLRQSLFSRKTSAILTSATFSDRAAESHSSEWDGSDSLPQPAPLTTFAKKCGADTVPAVQVASPFDYENNMRVFLATDAPEYSAGTARLDTAWLAETIGWCSKQFHGGTLALFTSYMDLNAVVQILTPEFQALGRPLLAQGTELSRSELIRQFKESGNALLCGTDSFWNGIDVPGPALSQVIITRLPFENPSNPVAEARAEAVQEKGGKPFFEITLPDAVVKFRQGVGRLIRTQEDVGTVTILDSRILRKEYGKRFLSMLPQKRAYRFSRENRDKMFVPMEV
ncbi:MAG: ATP-dependent DNA helicase [Verrucomicrobiota bacterium]|nr:ATP-dependent DNA helicase [Verrucomicrobiota bacterium]